MTAARRLLTAALALGLVAPLAANAGPDSWRYVPHLPIADLNAPDMAMVYDPARSRVLIVGGREENGVRGLIWALPTAGGTEWRPLPSEGAPHTLVFSIQACFDAAHDRVAVWDGAASTLWTVTMGTPAVWTSRVIPGPAPRLNAAACTYDAVHGRMILFGGYDGQAVRSDVWALPLDDVSAWSKLAPINAGPTVRMSAVALFDAADDRLIVHGGRDFSGPMKPRGDVWALSLSGTPEWTALFTADTTADRRWWGHAAVLDATRRRFLVFGGGFAGSGPDGDRYHDEVSAFALDGSNAWSVAVPADPARGTIRGQAFVAYDAEHDAMFEYGMRDGDQRLATFRLQLAADPAWAPVVPDEPWAPTRLGQATFHDPVRERWLAFGGRYTYYVQHDLYPTTYDDLWSFRPDAAPRWEPLPVTGPRPPERQDGRLVYDPVSDRAILFGGNLTDGLNPRLHPLGTLHFRGDTWSLDPQDPASWTELAVGGPAPGPRDGHVMVLDEPRRRMLLFGGRGDAGGMADLWALSLDGVPAWSQLSPSGTPPSPRWQAAGAYDAGRQRLIVTGGRGPEGPLTDTWELRLDGPTLAWTPLVTTGTPPTTGTYSRPFVFDPERRRLLVFGTGEDLPDPSANAVWELSLDGTPSWALLAPLGTAPAARYGAAAALDVAHDRVAFFAGARDVSGSTDLRDHWLLQLSTETPTAIQVSLASSNATPERVTLSWWCARALADARVERRGDTETWRTLGAAEVGGDGYVHWLDAGVEPGHRYAYRLQWHEGSRQNVSAETWVEVPGRPEFTLHAITPNPSTGDVLLTFELPDAAHAELAIFDLGGRRIESREVGSLGAGRHALHVRREHPLSPGLYLVRLTRSGREATRRLFVIR